MRRQKAQLAKQTYNTLRVGQIDLRGHLENSSLSPSEPASYDRAAWRYNEAFYHESLRFRSPGAR